MRCLQMRTQLLSSRTHRICSLLSTAGQSNIRILGNHKRNLHCSVSQIIPDYRKSVQTTIRRSSTAAVGASKNSWSVYIIFAIVGTVSALGVLDYNRRDIVSCLNEKSYVDYELRGRRAVTKSTSIIELEGPVEHLKSAPPILAVSVRNPSSNIQRPYTVLDITDDSIKLLIKRYDSGEISPYLNEKAIRSKVSIRLVPSTIEDPGSRCNNIVFIAGGTGISAAFQLCTYLNRVMDLAERPIVHILYASRRREDIYLQREFEALNQLYGNKIRTKLFIDEEGSFIDANAIQEVAVSGSHIIVCGSTLFNKFITGAENQKDYDAKRGGGLLSDTDEVVKVSIL